MADDLTIEILKQIRDNIGQTNTRLDRLTHDVNDRFERLEGRFDRLDSRVERVENGLNDLGTFMKQIALDQAKHERFHHQHVEVIEKDVKDLQQRVRKLEDHAEH